MKTTTFDELLSRVLMRSGRDTNNPTIADYPDVAEILNLRLQEIWDYPGGGWDFLKEVEPLEFLAGMSLVGFGQEGADGYYERQTVENQGRPVYINSAGHQILWTNVAWVIFRNPDEDDAYWYSSAEDVATPDLVQTWADISSGGNGLPIGTVTATTVKEVDVSDGRTVLGVYASDPRETGCAEALRTRMVEGGILRLSSRAPDTVWVQFVAVAPDWIEDTPLPEDVYQVFASAAISLTYADMLLQESGNEGGKFSVTESKGYKRLNELCERYAIMDTQGGRIHVRR